MKRPVPTADELRRLDPENTFPARLAGYRASLATVEPGAAETSTIIHRLAGAAGTFGFAELGELAMTLDDRLRDGGAATASEVAALIAALDRALGEVQKSV